MPDLLRRVVALTVLSAAGIAVLAPLAAQSAPPAALKIDERLVDVAERPAVVGDRGGLTARGVTAALSTEQGAEAVAEGPMPTPAGVTMEATLHVIPTPTPTPTPAPTPPPTPAPPAPVVAAPAPQRVVTYDGDTVWDRLAQCEASGNWAANTGNGYYGGLQFSYSTWHGYDGGEFAEYPHEATREEQITVAKRLHAARGFQPWPACRVKLGLP